MNAAQLQSALALSGISARVRSGEVQVETCLYCGNDRWNLEVNPAKGVFHCWNCNESGRAADFVSRFTGQDFDLPVDVEASIGGDRRPGVNHGIDIRPAEEVASALQYLQRKRRLDVPSIRAYGLCVCWEEDHPLYGRLLIPVRDFWTRGFLGYIGRSYSGARPKYLSTVERRTVTGWRARDRTAPTIIVEGHFDGIAVHRAGFSAAVLGGTSAGEVDLFAARVPPDAPLLIMLDGSARDEARRLRARVEQVRDVGAVALPPEIDPADLTPEGIASLVSRSLVGTR